MDMDMGDMGDSMNSSMMNSSSMMVFHTGITDSLYSMQWTPSTPGQYAGTWIFLLVLGIIARALTSGKVLLEEYWHKKFSSVSVVIHEKDGTVQTLRGPKVANCWRTSVDLPRAGLQLVTAGVYYLLYQPPHINWHTLPLMIAVMTMNVGYFFAVLAGLFFGELFFGRYSSHAFGYQDHAGTH